MIKKSKRGNLTAGELTEQDMKEINFAVGQTARHQHKCDKKYKMPITLEQEIKLILCLLKDDKIGLSTPFTHIVPIEENFETAWDSCKKGGGGWSRDLTFWWHIEYKAEVL